MLQKLRSIVIAFALAFIGVLALGTGTAAASSLSTFASTSSHASCASKSGYKYVKKGSDCVKKKPIECVSGYKKTDDKCVKNSTKKTGDGDCTNLKYRDDQGFKCSTVAKEQKTCNALKAHAIKTGNGNVHYCVKKGGKTCTKNGKDGSLAVFKLGKYSKVCLVPNGKADAKL